MQKLLGLYKQGKVHMALILLYLVSWQEVPFAHVLPINVGSVASIYCLAWIMLLACVLYSCGELEVIDG